MSLLACKVGTAKSLALESHNEKINMSRSSFCLAVAFVALLVVTGESAGARENSFRAACVKVDITPDGPQWMLGYGKRKSTGVHDRIYHRIVAMDDGSTQFFLVSSDIAIVSCSYHDNVAKQLKDATGIEPQQFWWSATHTHAAPHVGPLYLPSLFSKTLGDRLSFDPDEDYWKIVRDSLIQGIKDARSKLEPARLGIGTGESFANINRRGKNAAGKIVLGEDPDGPVDRQLAVIRIERSDGSPIALITNYAIHGTVLGSKNTLISGDVTGIISEYIEKQVGAPMPFVNGAEGDIAPLYSVRDDFASSRMDEFYTLLGSRILATNDSIKQTTPAVEFSIDETVIETPRKQGLSWPDALASYASVSREGTPQVRVPVPSLTINRDTVIWAAPLELFCEIAMNVREASPFENTFYFGLTNGSLMYLPTSVAFSEGGYEPNVSPFSPQAQADFTAGVIRHVRDLANP